MSEVTAKMQYLVRGGVNSFARSLAVGLSVVACSASDPENSSGSGSDSETGGGSTQTTTQLSCNALLGFGLPEADGKAFVDRLWQAQIPTGQWRYYDGTLYMLGLLHVAGAFKLYY